MQDPSGATKGIPLGKTSDYPKAYSPDVLYPIARAENRARLGLGDTLPFHGTDLWTAWELTWLTPSGKPAVAAAEIGVPADSPNIIESKSLKLYLGALAMTTVQGEQELIALLRKDLSAAAGAPVSVALGYGAPVEALPGETLDNEEVDCSAYSVDAGLLHAEDTRTVTETVHSQLLRSLCPVTAQPDFGSVMIRYRGPRVDRAGLLRYIVSFREHNDFHEACVERMFMDIKTRCRTERLSVYARYLRRGGLDINPFRSDFEPAPENARLWNQ
ncbi:MAG: NADPH-dependent 7-cyano-7-deazaguanine reductase QueF [Pseudomonadota bacterium]